MLTAKTDPWEYTCSKAQEIDQALGKDKFFLSGEQVYAGNGIVGIFRTPLEVRQLRLGRTNFQDNRSYSFTKNSGLAALVEKQYSVFIPCSIDNINNILAGRSFKFSTANIDEDKAGHVQSIYSQSLENHMGTVQDLVMLMPRKRISGVSSVDVRIGDALFSQVKSSNPDDGGVVEIASITGGSIVTYHPEKSEPPQPLFQWGSGGWTNPLKVKVEASRLFFDERDEHERPDGKLWLLDFQRDGYRTISL